MEPDSEETRRRREPEVWYLAFVREWIMNGGAMEEVAGDWELVWGLEPQLEMEGRAGGRTKVERTVHLDLFRPLWTIDEIFCRKVPCCDDLAPSTISASNSTPPRASMPI